MRGLPWQTPRHPPPRRWSSASSKCCSACSSESQKFKFVEVRVCPFLWTATMHFCKLFQSLTLCIVYPISFTQFKGDLKREILIISRRNHQEKHRWLPLNWPAEIFRDYYRMLGCDFSVIWLSTGESRSSRWPCQRTGWEKRLSGRPCSVQNIKIKDWWIIL